MNFFDEMAEIWDSRNRYDVRQIRFLLSLIPLMPGSSVLDIGTGTGVLLPFIRERIGQKGIITAVDSSPRMLACASRRMSADTRVRFIEADVERDILDGKYDAIILYSVFPHLRYPTDTVKQLIRYNLKPKGFLLIAHSDSRESLNRVHERVRERVYSARLLPIQEQAERFRNAGLNVTACDESDSFYYLVCNSTIHPSPFVSNKKVQPADCRF